MHCMATCVRWLPGMKPRMWSTLTMMPPRFAPTTRTSTLMSSWLICLILCHASAYCTGKRTHDQSATLLREQHHVRPTATAQTPAPEGLHGPSMRLPMLDLTSCCLSETQISPSFRLSWMMTNSRFEFNASTSSACIEYHLTQQVWLYPQRQLAEFDTHGRHPVLHSVAYVPGRFCRGRLRRWGRRLRSWRRCRGMRPSGRSQTRCPTPRRPA